VRAARQRQRVLELVVDDEHPGEAVPGVERGPVEAMVVVPLERGAFGMPALGQFVDVAFAPPGPDQQVVARGARREVLGDVAELRQRLRGGEPARLAVELGAVVAAVQVDAEFADPLRQLVVEGDLGAGARRAADRRAGKGATEGPQLRLLTREDLLLGEADRDLQPRPGQLRRQRQRLAEGDRRRGRPDPLQVGERPPDPAARQGGEQRAATQGAEEGPAPEAWRGVSALPGQLIRRLAAGP
jgi:hypothetical protein